MRSWPTKIIVFFALVVAFGCGDKSPAAAPEKKQGAREELTNGLTPEQAAKVVAKVGDRTITVGDVTEQINRLSPYIKRRWATPEKRREFLQKLIQIELLSQEAIRQGLDNSPEVQRAVKQVMVRLMVKNDLQKELFPSSIEEALLKEEYEREWKKYHSPAQHRISQIVVATREEAVSLIDRIRDAENPRAQFRELARTVSILQTDRNRAGDIGYVLNPTDILESKTNGRDRTFEQTPGVDKAIAEAAWHLERPGELLPEPIETSDGYHVLMLTAVKPALDRTYKSVKRLIENQLIREEKRKRMDDFIASLRKDAKVKIFKENLDRIQLNLSPETAPAISDDAKDTGEPSADSATDGTDEQSPGTSQKVIEGGNASSETI